MIHDDSFHFPIFLFQLVEGTLFVSVALDALLLCQGELVCAIRLYLNSDSCDSS